MAEHTELADQLGKLGDEELLSLLNAALQVRRQASSAPESEPERKPKTPAGPSVARGRQMFAAHRRGRADYDDSTQGIR